MTTKTTTKKTTSKTKASLDLPNNPFAFEVLHLASKQRTKAKKIEVLKRYEHISLKTIFIWNFDETVVSVLPPGPVPYSGYDDQNVYTGTLSTKIGEEVRKMHETGSFSMGSSDKQGHTTIRRETMFINLLEGLHPLEAEVVCLVKDKKLSDKYNISKELVMEAYPDITWGGRS